MAVIWIYDTGVQAYSGVKASSGFSEFGPESGVYPREDHRRFAWDASFVGVITNLGKS
jgi:hypothetical protein